MTMTDHRSTIEPAKRRWFQLQLPRRRTVFLALAQCGILLILPPLEVVAIWAFGGLIGMLFVFCDRFRRSKAGEFRVQFRLQTLMIFVTLLAAVVGYPAWEARTVREREACLAEIEALGGSFVSSSPASLFSTGKWDLKRAVGNTSHFDPKRSIPHFDKAPSVVRRWLGDETVFDIWLPDTVPSSDANRIDKCFPEAAVQRGESAP